jgi:hypothetical protein
MNFNVVISNFTVTCNAPQSMFAYPKAEEKKEDNKKLVATAVLSTTVFTSHFCPIILVSSLRK